MAWYEESFGRLYPLVYRHRSVAQAEEEVGFVIEALGLRPGETVLDLASGEGRHLGALRSRGLAAVGADLSPPLLGAARKAGLPVVRADMRALPFRRRFRAVLSFFTSFGYFEKDEENLGVLGEMAGCLEPGGRLLLDLPNREFVERNLVPRSEKSREGYRIREERRLEGDRMVKRIRITGENGEEEFTETVRLFGPEEIREGLRSAGIRPDRFYGGFDGSDMGPSRDRMIATAIAEARR
jgi:SAM-dependent methyltransferase